MGVAIVVACDFLEAEVAKLKAGGFERPRRVGVTGAIERETEMSEVTYYVALSFVASDGGVAPGEAIECSE